MNRGQLLLGPGLKYGARGMGQIEARYSLFGVCEPFIDFREFRTEAEVRLFVRRSQGKQLVWACRLGGGPTHA